MEAYLKGARSFIKDRGTWTSRSCGSGFGSASPAGRLKALWVIGQQAEANQDEIGPATMKPRDHLSRLAGFPRAQNSHGSGIFFSSSWGGVPASDPSFTSETGRK